MQPKTETLVLSAAHYSVVQGLVRAPVCSSAALLVPSLGSACMVLWWMGGGAVRVGDWVPVLSTLCSSASRGCLPSEYLSRPLWNQSSRSASTELFDAL
jgi:hypothetical protein